MGIRTQRGKAAETMLDPYLTILVLINVYFLATALSNIIYFRRATKKARIRRGPFVSVIVPARNEEHLIARCVESLLKQDYTDYEVIVVDDESSDATARIVEVLAARDPRLRLLPSGPLPDGWLGKPHALSQGAAAASGEILVFTDADTTHGRQSLSWAVTNLRDHEADLLSGYLQQEYGGLGEGIVVPTLYAMMLLLPFFLLPRTKPPRIAFSIGQFVAVRREAFDGIGGFEAIKDSILDDVSMAIRVKEFGYSGVFLDASGAASCHMYDGFRDAFDGVRRSVYSAVGGHPLAAAAVSLLVLGAIVLPAFWVIVSGARLIPPNGYFAVAAALFAGQWALVAWNRKAPFITVAFYPLVFLNLVIILNASMLRTGFGRGVDWKGRLVRMPRRTSATRPARLAER